MPPSYCYSLATRSSPALCDLMDCSTPSSSLLQSSRVCSNSCPLSRWCDLTISSSVTPFSCCLQSFPASESLPMNCLHIRWPKYWNFSFRISPSNEYSGLISFRIDWFDLLAVQGTLKSLLQHHNSKASVLWCSAFFMMKFSHLYRTTGKPIVLTIGPLLAKWCLCFLICCPGLWCFPGSSAGKESAYNAEDPGLIPGSGRSPGEGIGFPLQYSRASLVAQTVKSHLQCFLPRSKCLWISWLQSPPAVLLEPKKRKSVAAFTVSPLLAMKWWNWIPCIVFWMLSFKPAFSFSSFTLIWRLFRALSLSALVWYYHMHIWGCWYFSWQSWFQLMIHPAWLFAWCTLHRS